MHQCFRGRAGEALLHLIYAKPAKFRGLEMVSTLPETSERHGTEGFQTHDLQTARALLEQWQEGLR